MNYAMLGAAITAHRKALGLTQAELAERAGISTAFIGHIERGSRIPSLATMVAIADALSTPLDALIPAASCGETPASEKNADLAAARSLLILALRLCEAAQK